MKVSVKLLALYKVKLPEGTEGSTCEMEVHEDISIEEIMKSFDIAVDPSNVILVNGHVPEPGQKLNEGDVVCAFPAYAGG
jgi:hypothetical protein